MEKLSSIDHAAIAIHELLLDEEGKKDTMITIYTYIIYVDYNTAVTSSFIKYMNNDINIKSTKAAQ